MLRIVFSHWWAVYWGDRWLFSLLRADKIVRVKIPWVTAVWRD